MNAPGSTLYQWASHLCDDTTVARVLDPWRADLQFELTASRTAFQRIWTRLVYGAAWLRVVGHFVIQADGVSRVIGFQIGGVIAVTILFFVGPLWQITREVHASVAGWLLPSAIVAALPLGMCLGLALAIKGCGTAPGRAAALSAAIACLFLTMALLQFLLPQSNQTFRVAYANEAFPASAKRPIVLLRGVGEMSLTELAVQSRQGAYETARNLARRELYGRLTLVTAAVALTPFLLFVVGPMRFPRLAGFLLIAAYYVSGSYQRQWMRTNPSWMFIVAWAPNLLLLASAMFARRHRRIAASSPANE